MAKFTTNFSSEALKRPITIDVVLPTDHEVMANLPMPEKNRPYKTLYMLEGVTGNYSGPVNYSSIMPLAEDYNLAIVTIGGENKWWGNSVITGDHFGKMILDVVNFTRRAFNLSRKREDTYIGGFSMGGYGAFVNGFRNPELFSRIVALDSALNKAPILESVNEPTWDLYYRRHYEAMFGYENIASYENSDNDYEFLAAEIAKLGAEKMPKIFMGCGAQDQLYEPNIAFREYLLGLGYDVTWEEYEGKHSWYSFNKGIDAAVKWLPLDTFLDNVIYYGPESSIDGTNFAHWNAWYNVEMKEV